MLGRIGVGDAEHVPCELDERMLESTACAEKWPIPRPGELDRPQRALHVAIGSSGGGKQAGAFGQATGGRGFEQRRSRQPADLQPYGEPVSGMPERAIGCFVCAEI